MGFLSSKFRLKLARLALGAGLVMSAGSTALANPEGPTVRHGQINFSPGTQAQIQQLTDRAIVDWQSFSIGRTESLVFLQPSQLSVILNRVTGGDPSAILGQLSANGNVFLINPNGILFGPDSVVNVGGLVASTLNLNDDDFLAGNYRFFADPNGELGAVVNQGRITISDGGYAVLTGPAVLNEGMIVAKAGKVVLASGERATLNLDGRDLVHFSLDSSIGEGDVLLAPGALSETLADALGVNPALRADRLVQEADGSVRMVRSSGTLVQAGTVSVNGSDGVDAGSILVDSTDVTILATDSVTSASGVGIDSQGGEVFVLSDMDGDRSLGFTDVHSGALISATGGTTGNAGFVEVSGNRLNLFGEVDLSAAGGEGGTFLLDPQTYTIIDGDNMPTTVGDLITVGDQYFNTLSGTTLVITSTGDVIFDLGTQGTNPTNDGVMNFRNVSNQLVNLTINSGTDPDPDGIIDFGDDGITVSGLSALTLNSEGGVLFGDSNITVNGSVNVDSVGAIQLQTGTLRVTNGGDITFDGEAGIALGSGSINPGAGGGTTGFIHLLSDGSIDLGSSALTVDAGGRTNPLSITAGDPLDLLAPPADLNLGDAQISVFSSGNPGGNSGLILTATGDIDFGSSDLTYTQNRSTGSYQDRIIAGGNIYSSAAPDGDPNNFLNNYIITGDSGPLDMTAGGSIVLTDLFLDVNEFDGTPSRFTTIAANGGDLNLGNSEVSIANSLTLTSSANIIFDSPTLETQNDGDIDIDAGGTVTLQNGTVNSTGFLHIHGDGDVSLGTSTLTVNSTQENNPLSITAGDPMDTMAPPANLNLGDAQMTVNETGTAGGDHGLILSATGDIDLGSSDLTFSQNRNAGSYLDRITAGGSIFTSAAPDGDPNNFLNNYTVTGDSGAFLMTAGGSIVLTDLFLDVNEVDSNLNRATTIAANGGVLNLGSSQINIEDHLSLASTSDILFDAPSLTTQNGGDIDIDAGGTVTLQNGTVNSTGFLHIHGDGDVSLGTSTLTVNSTQENNPLSITAGDPMDTMAPPANLNLGDAQMMVTEVGTASGDHGLILSATGDIDLGSSDLTFSQDRNAGSYLDRITAGGSIFTSAAPDGDPNNFLNNYTITGDSGAFLMTAGGSIVLTDLFLDVNEVDSNLNRATTIAANGGVLNLGSSQINIEDHLSLASTSDILFDAPSLTTQNGGDIDIDAGGTVTLQNGTVNSTGFLHIHGDGDVSLGTSTLTVNSTQENNPLSITAGDPMDTMAPPANLNLGDAQMTVNETGTAGGDHGLILSATGDIDLGSSDLTFSQDRNAGSYLDRITAGGSIFTSAAPDGDPNNFLNNYTITGDSGAFLMTAGGSIVLTDLFLDINETDDNLNRATTIAANGGVLDLGSSQINIEDHLSLSSSSDILFDAPSLTTQNGGDLDIDAVGTVTLQNGTLDSTGFLHIHGDGDVSLGTSTLTVNSTQENNPLSITAGDPMDTMAPPADLNLGDAQMTVNETGTAGGDHGLIISATGNIDLGSSDLVFSQDRVSGNYQDRITAGGSIFTSAAPDGDPNSFLNNYSIAGDSGDLIINAGSDILLPDINLFVAELDNQVRNVIITAESGQLQLGESNIVSNDGDARLQASGLIDAGASRVTAKDQLVLSTNTSVSADGSRFTAPDIEIFGFDPMSMIPGGAVNGDVRLDLGITTTVDLTVLATGDVEINNVGGGTIVAEQIGGVAFSSSGGDVTIRTDGNLTRQGGGTTEVSAAGAVTLVADNILGSPYRVQGSEVLLDISAVNGSSMNVDIQGSAPSFLSVAGNDSTIAVRELASGRSLTVIGNQVDLPDLGIEEILVSNTNGLVLNSLTIRADQSVGMKAITGDITATATNSVNLAGSLALEAGGSVGQNLLPINVAGGTLAVDSGNQVFIEGTGPDLTIGTVLFDKDPNTPQKTLTGVTAAGDIEIAMTGAGPTELIQDADISSTGGNVALAAVEGSLVQNSGTVRGADIALQADGNAGEFDGTTVLSEFSVEADRLVLNIGGDAVINQSTGDLAITQQTTVGGDVYTGTGTGGDLRVRNSGGDLTVDADIVAGGNAALITGNNLTVNQAPLPNSILFNGSVTAGDSLVVISAGDINQSSGTLTAPKIGLGAVGQIGTAGQPISVVTDEMALNPLNAQVSDPNGFAPVASVSAVGATVNQGLPTPDPEPVVPPTPPIPPDTVIPPSAFEPPADFVQDEFAAEAFSANNTEMVEEIFAVLEMLDDPIVEEDPTRVPILWPEDEDFLQKKFRR